MNIVMVCAAGIPISPGILQNQSLGGSETAFICMSQALAGLGHSITAYIPLEPPQEDYVEQGVSYREINKYVEDKTVYDIAVFSRDLSIVVHNPPKAIHTVLWLHDMPAPDKYAKTQSSNFWAVDEVFVLSDYHRRCWVTKFDILENHHWITRNGIDTSLIAKSIEGSSPPVEKKSLIFMSRPERGLANLLSHLWPKILSEISPDIELKICSYATPTKLISQPIQNLYTHIDKLIDEAKNVRRLGNLTKKELYKELRRSNALIYPTDFPEISCISVAEAAACGIPVITTNKYALPETLGKGYPGLVNGNPASERAYYDNFIVNLRNALDNPTPYIQAGYDAVNNKDWNVVAGEWANRFEEKIAEKGCYVKRTIAGCMIVKNESNNIIGCLESFSKYMDEVHITDTGSTDNTLKLIEEWDARRSGTCPQGEKVPQIFIHHRDTLGEFDDARNQSISYTNCDWIFWIDADERLTGGKDIEHYLNSAMFNGCIIEQCHFYLDMKPSSDTPVRLFKNKPLGLPFVKEPFKEISFIGAIHEHPMQGDCNFPVHPVLQLSNVRVAHYGYLTEDVRRSKVRDRNLRLLMKDREKWPIRYNGFVLTMRDLIHMFGWALEQGQTNGTYLVKVISIYKDHFQKYETGKIPWYVSQIYDHAYEQYQFALSLAASHNVQVADNRVPFSTKLHVGISYGQEAPTPQNGTLRWFIHPEEFTAYMENLAEKTLEKLDDGNPNYDI